jgi:hypothetical protein
MRLKPPSILRCWLCNRRRIRRLAGACGLGLLGVDALRVIHDAEDYRDVLALGGGEKTITSLQRHAEPASAESVDADERDSDDAVQSCC